MSIDNLLLFPTVKEFSKSINSWWSYRRKFDTTFFSETQCIFLTINNCNNFSVTWMFLSPTHNPYITFSLQKICPTLSFCISFPTNQDNMLLQIIATYDPCDNDSKSLQKKTTVVVLEWCRKNEFIKITRRSAAAAAARQSLHYVIITHDWQLMAAESDHSIKSTSWQLGELINQLPECRPLLRSTNKSLQQSQLNRLPRGAA